jgi:hypothetical protein
MESDKIAGLAETLSGYLAGDRVGDFKTQESFRQLAKRVLAPLSDSESALLRQSPAGHRTLLFGALSEALRNDPVARHLATQLGAPEMERPPEPPPRPQAFGDVHFDVRGNGNVVGNGNTIGSLSVPQSAGPHGKARQARLIRILFLTASPDATVALHTDREARDIQEALRQSEFREQFELRQEPAVRIGDLQRCLLQHRPDILHFSGHGEDGALLLEGRNGEIIPLSGSNLSRLLSVLKDRTRCVLLNACYSALDAQSIAGEIASVIARPDVIDDRAAILFATYFYQALAFGRSVKTAFDLACLQLRMEGWEDEAHPVLLAQWSDPAEILFAESAEES